MESNIKYGPLGEPFASSVGEISNFIGTSSSRENAESKENARMPDTQSEDVDMPLKPSCLVEIQQRDDLENNLVQLRHNLSDQLPPQGSGGELMGQCAYISLPLIVDIAGAKAANNNSIDLGPCVADAKKSSVMGDSFHLASQNQSKNDIKQETEDVARVPLSNISDIKTENIANSVKEPDANDSQTDNENSESDILEDDVKVCDICGDVGREELLAICSRCSDGAEHTYCMRIMLLKLPDGDWLCEECKLREDDESKKININSEDLGVFSNAPLPDLDFKLPATTLGKKCSHNSHASNKVSSASTSIGSETNTKTAEVAKSDSMLLGTFNNLKPSLVQEASCKIAASKGKAGNITSHPRSHPATSIVTPALPSNSSKPEARLLSPRGSLPSMDNVRSKVKSVLENLKLKSKLLPESTVVAVKKERAQSFVRSASFRSQSTNSPNTDSTSKTYSFNQCDPQNIVLGKQKSTTERKNSLILDRPQNNLSAFASTNIMSAKLEQKDARPEGRVGAGEARKQPPYTPKSSGLLSLSGQPISMEQKPCQIFPKDEASVSSGASDRISDGTVEHGPSQSDACAGRSDKNKETGDLRSIPFAAVRGHRCQKCNEMGHLTQFCSVDKIRLSALKPSALKPSCEQNARDPGNKTSKWRHAIEAALLKTQTQKNLGFPAHPSNLFLPNNSLSRENSSKDLKSNLTIHDRSLSAVEGDKTAICSDVQQHDVSKIEATHSSDMVFGIGGSKSKSLMQNAFAGQASAIPELDCIWLGCFEVQRNGQFSDKCYNVQAHLSTLASPKVSNVVTKFPDKVQLEEVSCMSAWPSQFRTRSPMEDNIALFFFATDGESCEKSYYKLLENMLQNDLALKGSLDGVELLIFPSNKLPESCQRWNRLFFLWGVFGTSKADIPVHLNGTQKKLCGDRFDVPNFVRGSTHTVKASGGAAAEACEQGNVEFPVCNTAVISENGSQNRDVDAYEQNSLHLDSLPSGKQSVKAGAIIEQAILVHESSKHTILSDKKHAIEERKDDAIYLKDAAPNLWRKEAIGSVNFQTRAAETGSCEKRLSPLVMDVASKRSEFVSILTELSRPKSPVACEKVSDGSVCKGKVESKGLEIAAVSGQLKDHVLGKESPSWESRINLKRSRSSLPELAVQASASTVTASWKELDHLSREVIPSKKIKVDVNDQCSVIRDENHGHGFSSKVYPVHGSYLDEATDGCASCNEVFRKDSTSSEMVFFPVDTSSSKEPKSLGFVSFPIVAPSVEDTQERDAPNLDLALGAERKPKSGILPLFFPLSGKVTEEVKPPDPMVGNGDDGSATLSLSLAFPFPEERQAQRREYNLLPERAKPDTSLLLFGRFTDS